MRPGAPAEDAPAPSTAARSDEPSGIVSPEAPAGATPTIWAPQFRLDPNAGETVAMLFDRARWTEIDRSDRSDVEVFFDPQGRLWSLRSGGFERFDGTRWISNDPTAPPWGLDLSISPDGTCWLIGWEWQVYRIQADR